MGGIFVLDVKLDAVNEARDQLIGLPQYLFIQDEVAVRYDVLFPS